MKNNNNLPIYFSLAVVFGVIVGVSLNGNLSDIFSLNKNSSQEIKLKRLINFIEKEWQAYELFDWIKSKGNIQQKEMLSTFNCGIGMVVIVARGDVANAQVLLEETGENITVIGEVRHGPHGAIVE